MKRFAALLMSVGIGAILSHASVAAPLNYEDYPIIKLRSLDKITARTMNFEAKVGSTIRFGDIFIKVQACRKPPPIEKNEAAAFLQIYQANEAEPDDKKDDAKSSWIFSGWMFASSPAISAMDHPIYDVWVLDCLGRDPEPLPPPEQQAADAEAKEGDKEKAPENKEQNDGAPNNDTAATPHDNAPTSDETKTDTPEPDESVTPQTESATPAPDTQNNEPSVDDMLQPEKATAATGTKNDDDYIYSPSKAAPQPTPTQQTPAQESPVQNNAPLTEPNITPDNPVSQESVPTPQPQNPSSPLDGIY